MSDLANGPDYSVRPYSQNMSNDSSPVSASDLKDVKKMADNVVRKMWGIDIRYSISESMRLLDDIVASNRQRQTDVEEQFQDVIENTTDKDVISAPEIIAARDGEANLKARLDKEHQEVTAQLAQTPSYDYVDMIISNVVSGAPKGTFLSLESLESTYPNGAEGVFLVLENNSDASHVYFWNGSNWEDAGIYQSAGLASVLTTENTPWEVV